MRAVSAPWQRKAYQREGQRANRLRFMQLGQRLTLATRTVRRNGKRDCRYSQLKATRPPTRTKVLRGNAEYLHRIKSPDEPLKARGKRVELWR